MQDREDTLAALRCGNSEGPGKPAQPSPLVMHHLATLSTDDATGLKNAVLQATLEGVHVLVAHKR
jgi:hypothetical protein